ncbi:MAG TPA: M1 family metallopeptidase [Nitrososphaerales archaeon]|nr:M1 family metallopeptidase [Nitrososphaerales archaeon]
MVESYDLDLDVNFDDAVVMGKVTIRSSDPAELSELDAEDLTILDVSSGGDPVSFRQDREKKVVKVPDAGSSRDGLTIRYEKRVSDKTSTGFYKSKYGREYFLATDFEPDRAKTFFPCKDDPALKAVFNLRVVADSDLLVISNSEVARTEDLPNSKRATVFETTPRMSTYLFFFGVGRYVEDSSTTENGTSVIVAHRPQMKGKTAFTLGICKDVLRESEEYFRTPYPLKKLHLVALTELPGAMENWGAITSYEGILVDESSSAVDQRSAAIIAAHEIQHQWFGDLVTMRWWDDVWLNESFADFMSYKVMDRLRPKWDLWSDFAIAQTFASMGEDISTWTHPIHIDIESPSAVHDAFDQISYGKGASVIRMIESYLGEGPFRDGISEYIRTFSYGNARGEDLWSSLAKASNQPVSHIMSTWVNRPGFPLVSVSLKDGKLVFDQKRFVLKKKSGSEEGPWPIPLNFRANGVETRRLFDTRSMEFDLEGGELADVKVNSGQTGYYCVKYDAALYDRIAASFEKMSNLDRAGVINDIYQLLKANEVSAEEYLRFVRLCRELKDYPTLLAVSTQLRLLDAIADSSKALVETSKEHLHAQLRRLSTSHREGEPETDKVLRGRDAMSLVMTDADFAVKLASTFERYHSLPAEMKGPVGAAYARTGGAPAYDVLARMLGEAGDELARDDLYLALSSFDDPNLVLKSVELCAAGPFRSDIFFALGYSSRNPRARRLVWDWLKSNTTRLWELMGSPLQAVYVYRGVVPLLAVEDEEGARSFFARSKLPMGERSVAQLLELVSVNAGLRRTMSSVPG